MFFLLGQLLLFEFKEQEEEKNFNKRIEILKNDLLANIEEISFCIKNDDLDEKKIENLYIYYKNKSTKFNKEIEENIQLSITLVHINEINLISKMKALQLKHYVSILESYISILKNKKDIFFFSKNSQYIIDYST